MSDCAQGPPSTSGRRRRFASRCGAGVGGLRAAGPTVMRAPRGPVGGLLSGSWRQQLDSIEDAEQQKFFSTSPSASDGRRMVRYQEKAKILGRSLSRASEYETNLDRDGMTKPALRHQRRPLTLRQTCLLGRRTHSRRAARMWSADLCCRRRLACLEIDGHRLSTESPTRAQTGQSREWRATRAARSRALVGTEVDWC